MESHNSLDELLICRIEARKRAAEPCTMVIFGASGDLTARKLMPACYHLFAHRQMPDPFRIIGFARREKSHESWRAELREAVQTYSRTPSISPDQWSEFSRRLFYCTGDIHDPSAYTRLGEMIAAGETPALRHHLLFYLATSPSQFTEISQQLHAAGLLNKTDSATDWQRLVVEKPFGQNLSSAIKLNDELASFVHEKQLFRIDHYLGKETVQNILVFRFCNPIFELLWNRESVDHVQITVSEKLGVGSRGGFYEEAGALRDVVQNHLLQVLALVAMEPPVSLDAEAMRDEKMKLLKSVRPLESFQIPMCAVRGQYTAGIIDHEPRVAYRQEPKVNSNSQVETYVAVQLIIDNWRWAGVPFYLRTGKSLAAAASEIRVQFRRPPPILFAAQCGPKLDNNSITLRLQPNEGISLRFTGKIPGISHELRPVQMKFDYHSEFEAYTPEAYERLLLDAMAGDATLFIRRDLVEVAWSIVDPVRAAWDSQPLTEQEFYPAGSWGPAIADELLLARRHAWHNPNPAKD